jgi:glucan phosphoethanolaminetransferase (alkaline phosphatase superfamily)
MKSEYLDVSNLQITTDEAWENELKRLRKIYTERGALLASLLFPIIMVADYLYKMSEDGYVEWFIVRLAPSFLILITFLLLKNVNKQWKYHLLLFITIGSLFTSSAYKISEQQTWTSFLSSNVILVVAMSTLIVARGWLVYFLFGYFFFINLVLNIYQHQDETFTMFMSNYGVSLLALGAVFIFAAETRFAIMKRNFINSLALQNYLKLLEKQKHVIERKNEDITASINYAQKIQKNILPRPEEIEEYIEEYFILFKPRDIVS